MLTWCTKNEDSVEAFAGQLVATLEGCFTECKKISTQKEKLWERYYTLRATKEFADNWASFLKSSGAAPSRTLYQHITDVVFNHLIKEHYTTISEPTPDPCTSTLEYNEKNALRYISGYISRQVYRNLKDSKHILKDELCLCLSEMNDVDPDEMEDESSEWISVIDRGGLKHVTNTTYSMFASMEIELRKHIQSTTGLSELNILGAKKQIMESDDVIFYWSMVSSNWEEEVASILLEMVISSYVTIRGHSTASAWLEKFKRESKKSVQKSKGVRKQLISKSTPSCKESTSGNTTED